MTGNAGMLGLQRTVSYKLVTTVCACNVRWKMSSKAGSGTTTVEAVSQQIALQA
jgi:hypothetical protein